MDTVFKEEMSTNVLQFVDMQYHAINSGQFIIGLSIYCVIGNAVEFFIAIGCI